MHALSRRLFLFVRGATVKFAKPALTIDQQVDLLLSRGMLGDREKMTRRLAVVSYYRLSGYWFHRKEPDDTFSPTTRFDVVWDQYIFDRKLRILVMDAVERIEVGLRTQFSYHHAHAHGPFGYAEDPAALPKLWGDARDKVLLRINDEVRRSKERFVEHFADTYGDEHKTLPIWMATEVMSFGCVLSLWQASSKKVKNEVAKAFGVSDEVLRSWLWSLNEVRNVCAHHGRLWNRDIGNKPSIPYAKHHPDWHHPVMITNLRVFGVLTVCAHSLARLAPNSCWQRRLVELLRKHPHVPIKNMGFPENWQECPIWKGTFNG
jgi:abortive infection bacteriophage resistance protein